MTICAGLLVAGAALTFLTVRDDVLRAAPVEKREPCCRHHCAVGAPPLEPDRTAMPPRRASGTAA
jgi:hypothetical protein